MICNCFGVPSRSLNLTRNFRLFKICSRLKGVPIVLGRQVVQTNCPLNHWSKHQKLRFPDTFQGQRSVQADTSIGCRSTLSSAQLLRVGNRLQGTDFPKQIKSILFCILGCSGGQVVSVLAFYSDDSSSNPIEVYIFSVKCVFEKNEINKKRPWLAHF